MKIKAKRFIWVAVAVVMVGGLLYLWKTTPGGSGTADINAGMQTGDIPWIAETDHLRQRLAADGLPALSAEGTVLHIHQHLDVYIHGKLADTPEGIGIGPLDAYISSIHTHDATGIIHVESPTQTTFTLGQFFDVWGVKFDRTCIGGYCAAGDNKLQVFANGQSVAGDPRQLALAAHQEIVVAFGTAAELPNPIPASFTFPEGD